jgi:hypothetical protein
MTQPSELDCTPDERARVKFEHDTAEHEMTMLHDDGLYRHLRFQKPGTWVYGHDLVTWPGYLAITGDAGEYMFSRTADMFKFFAGDGDRINPYYWSEKLCSGGQGQARHYSKDVLREHVLEWYGEAKQELDTFSERARLRRAIDEQILDRDTYDEGEAHRLLREFVHEGRRIYEPCDWDLREYDHRFLWCCWAIIRGIKCYQEALVLI